MTWGSSAVVWQPHQRAEVALPGAFSVERDNWSDIRRHCATIQAHRWNGVPLLGTAKLGDDPHNLGQSPQAARRFRDPCSDPSFGRRSTTGIFPPGVTSMSGRLDGKVAIITGGTSGIGEAAVHRFVAEGARVVVGARGEAAGQRQVDEIGSGSMAFLPTDMTDPESVRELVGYTVERFGAPSILYSNAGEYLHATATETDAGSWQHILDVNLSGPFYLVKYGLPHLIDAGGGSIILTASELGLVGSRASVAYCAAKGGVVNMTRALAVDCKGTGVRVNCLAPGPIDTPLLRRGFAASGDAEAAWDRQTKPLLIERIGRPDEIAEAALFLASEASSYVSGAVLVVDGGATAWYGF